MRQKHSFVDSHHHATELVEISMPTICSRIQEIGLYVSNGRVLAAPGSLINAVLSRYAVHVVLDEPPEVMVL